MEARSRAKLGVLYDSAQPGLGFLLVKARVFFISRASLCRSLDSDAPFAVVRTSERNLEAPIGFYETQLTLFVNGYDSTRFYLVNINSVLQYFWTL